MQLSFFIFVLFDKFLQGADFAPASARHFILPKLRTTEGDIIRGEKGRLDW